MKHAVAFTTYRWDGFVERQYRRVLDRLRPETVFVIGDETGGSLRIPKSVQFIPYRSSDTARLIGRVPVPESKTLLWYNLDFMFYRFFEVQPACDLCLFMDFDAQIKVDIGQMLDRVERDSLDLVASHHPDMFTWGWATAHRPLYPEGVVRGSFLAVAVMRRRASAFLLERRRNLALTSAPGAVWPFCEAFVATELCRAGFRLGALSDHGSTEHLRWRPALTERQADAIPAGFIHPVREVADGSQGAPKRS